MPGNPKTTSPTSQQQHRRGLADQLADHVMQILAELAAAAWRWNLEILYALALPAGILTGNPLLAILGAIPISLLAAPRARTHVTRWYWRRHTRRQWRHATHTLGLQAPANRCTTIPIGHQLHAKTTDRKALETAHEQLASIIRARDITITRDPADASRITAHIRRHDPFDNRAPIPWPHRTALQLSLWDPIPIGVDEHGQPVTITLVERNLLLGGVPGAGKSTTQALLIASAALDPNTHLLIADGKDVDTTIWRACCHTHVGASRDQLAKLLRELAETLEQRFASLRARNQKKIQRSDGLPLYLLVIDELAYYLNAATKRDKEVAAEISERLRDLISRGRAAGIIIIAATQRPSADILPTDLRDLFAYRYAHRSMDNTTSDMILGKGWATQSHTAATIPDTQPGVGLLLAEGSTPQRIRSYMLDPHAEHRIARHAALPTPARDPLEQPDTPALPTG